MPVLKLMTNADVVIASRNNGFIKLQAGNSMSPADGGIESSWSPCDKSD